MTLFLLIDVFDERKNENCLKIIKRYKIEGDNKKVKKEKKER